MLFKNLTATQRTWLKSNGFSVSTDYNLRGEKIVAGFIKNIGALSLCVSETLDGRWYVSEVSNEGVSRGSDTYDTLRDALRDANSFIL